MTDRTPGRPERSDEVRAIPQGHRAGPAPRHRSAAPPPPTGPRQRRPGDQTRPIGVIPASARAEWLDADPDRTQAMSTGPEAVAATAIPVGPRDPAAATTAAPPTAPADPAALPPRRSGGPPSGPAARPGLVAPKPPRKRHRVRTTLIALVAAALAWGGGEAWAVQSSWSHVGRVADAPTSGHIAATKGHNTLLVGSDARSDLTPAQREELGTGMAEGARTDTIMVLHTGSGDPTLLSIPRDSYVEIPGHGMNKINAAFSIGGAPLLTETIEKATGLRIDGYVEIGFGGFAQLVDSVGGVRMCLKAPIKDEKAHIDLPAGCQTLDGKNALGYVRMRYSDPEGDLGRVKRQRQFLSALMGKVATPTTVLLPWRLHSAGTSAASAVAVGKDDSMTETASAFLGLRTISQGKGHSVTVPVADAGLQTPAGLAVQWDAAAASALFQQLRTDSTVTAPSTS